MNPPRIFVSYRHRDLGTAERIATLLHRAGLHPWFDRWDCIPGERWDTALARGLDSASTVLALVGTERIREVDAELRNLLARTDDRTRLIPVLLPGAEDRATLLADRTVVDLRDMPADSAAAAAAVLDAVLLAVESRPTPQLEPSRSELDDDDVDRVQRLLGADHPDVTRARALLATRTAAPATADAVTGSGAWSGRDRGGCFCRTPRSWAGLRWRSRTSPRQGTP